MVNLLGQRDFMLAKNADLEGDVRTLQHKSKGKRTSTIEMALSPEQERNAATHDLSLDLDSVDLLTKFNYHRTQNRKSNQRTKGSQRRQQQGRKSSSNGSNISPKQRSKSQERLKLKHHSSNKQVKQASSHLNFKQPMNRDMMAAVNNYHRAQPSDDLANVADKKTIVLWQDFQKMLAN